MILEILHTPKHDPNKPICNHQSMNMFTSMTTTYHSSNNVQHNHLLQINKRKMQKHKENIHNTTTLDLYAENIVKGKTMVGLRPTILIYSVRSIEILQWGMHMYSGTLPKAHCSNYNKGYNPERLTALQNDYKDHMDEMN